MKGASVASIAKGISDRSLERVVKVLMIVAILSTLAVAAYYVNDRYRQPNVSLLDREATRLEEMVRRDPRSVATRISVGDVYLGRKQYEQAIDQYGEALKLAPDDPAALLGIGSAYMAKGDTPKMEEYFGRLVQLNKNTDYALVDQRLERAYYQLGRVHLEKGNYEKSIENLRNAIAIDRTDSDALFLLGNALSAKGDYQEAVKAYRAAVTFVPNFVDAYRAMAQAYARSGEKAKEGYPRALEAYFSGDKAGALRQLEALAETRNDDPDVFWALGMARENAGHKERALEAYRLALALNPDHALANAGFQRLTKQSVAQGAGRGDVR